MGARCLDREFDSRRAEPAGHRTQGAGNQATTPSQQEVTEPPDEECTADPEQCGCDERPVGDRYRGDAFRGENDLISVAPGLPEEQLPRRRATRCPIRISSRVAVGWCAARCALTRRTLDAVRAMPVPTRSPLRSLFPRPRPRLPTTSAAAGFAPKLGVPNVMNPMTTATATPRALPRTPTTTASAADNLSSWALPAPRARNRAWSRRRRGAPESTTVAVSRTASTAAGNPRNRNRIRAYAASPRAASRAAPRLSPTSAPPALLASRLRAAAVTRAYAVDGSLGRSRSSAVWICMLTRSGRPAASGSKMACHWASGSTSDVVGWRDRLGCRRSADLLKQ